MGRLWKGIIILIIKLSIMAILFYILDRMFNPNKIFSKIESWSGYIGVAAFFIGEFIYKSYQDYKRRSGTDSSSKA